MQVLRLTTPNLHPSDEDLSSGTPETEKRLVPRSLRMTVAFLGWIFETELARSIDNNKQ